MKTTFRNNKKQFKGIVAKLISNKETLNSLKQKITGKWPKQDIPDDLCENYLNNREDYHYSKTRNEYEKLTDLNVYHLRNICKKEIQTWDSKKPFEEFIKSNKYFKTLSEKENEVDGEQNKTT